MTSARNRRRHVKDNESQTAVVSWPLVLAALECKRIRSIYIWGRPGYGKTHVAYSVGCDPNDVYAVSITEEMPASELRGTWLPRGDAFVWHHGPVVRAMIEGRRLVINELSHASYDVLAFLYPILENPSTARLTLPTGDTITPADGFRCIVTDNMPPDGLPEALRDRFETTIEITEPHPDALALLSPRLREAALECFDLEQDRRISLRGWLTLQRLLEEFEPFDACLLAFGAARGSQLHDAMMMAGGFE